ncbi:MAG: CYTH and CHAD domain-containing protein [Pseudomonadota bacterium]
MREIELKLELDEAQEKRLRAAPALKARGMGRARSEVLHSVYYDTDDQQLRASGIALRVRKAGRHWIQTVKRSNGPMLQGLSMPLEDECKVPGGKIHPERITDDDLRERVIGAAREGLVPVVETRFRRTRRNLALPGGGSAELAIDVGEVIGGGNTAPLIEAEIELQDGAQAGLYALASELIDRGPVRFSSVSKSERALALLNGGIHPPPLRKARPVAVDPGDTIEASAIAILSEGLAHYMPNVALLIESPDTAGPHQVRVSLRRLRSALTALRPVFGSGAVAPWNDIARTLGAEVGAMRDLDVLIEEMIRPIAEENPGETGFRPLLTALENRRNAVRDHVRAHMAGPEVTRWGLAFAAFLAGRGWLDQHDHSQTSRLAQPTGAFARSVLDKRWKRVAAYGRQMQTLSIEARHEMRKELKKLRYMIEAFRGLYDPVALGGFLRQIKDLQTYFGALNDAAMAEAVLTAPDAPGVGDGAASRAAGRLLGRLEAEAERLWPEASTGWDKLAKMRRFWR